MHGRDSDRGRAAVASIHRSLHPAPKDFARTPIFHGQSVQAQAAGSGVPGVMSVTVFHNRYLLFAPPPPPPSRHILPPPLPPHIFSMHTPPPPWPSHLNPFPSRRRFAFTTVSTCVFICLIAKLRCLYVQVQDISFRSLAKFIFSSLMA